MKPSQNVGIEKPETAKTITARSIQEPRRQAATTPAGTPTPTLMSMAKSVSQAVVAARWPMSVETGSPEKIDVPRSPRTTRPSQRPTWVVNGCSRPSRGRLRPLAPRHVGDLVQRELLDLLGELLAPGLIAGPHEVGDELLQVRDLRPAEPGVGPGARHTEVHGRVHDVGGHPPRVQQVPAALVGRVLLGAHGEIRRPVHRLELDGEAG